MFSFNMLYSFTCNVGGVKPCEGKKVDLPVLTIVNIKTYWGFLSFTIVSKDLYFLWMFTKNKKNLVGQ